jgi:methylthioribulose-1-phosphate dehydratase
MFSTVLTSPLRNMKYRPSPHSLELHKALPPPPAAPLLPESCVPNVYYLDDPTDGASAYLLAQMGLSLSRGGDITALRRAMPQVGLWLTAVHQEHSFPFPVRYSADEGGVAVDARDPGGAWVRVVLHEGDVLEVAAGAWHRAQRAPLALAEVAPSPLFAGGDAGALTSGTALAPHFVGRVQLPSRAGLLLMAAQAPEEGGGGGALAPREAFAAAALRFPPGAPADPLAAAPFFSQPGYPHTRAIVAELCNSFYYLGWVTGTGGSISIRTGGRIFMAPSAVQKERMQPQDMFVLDGAGSVLYAPAPLPGKVRLRVSQCAPLFQSAFALRGAGACIHTHSLHAVAATLPRAGEAPPREFRITHQEMIKGIAGHGYADTLVVPILENTPHEADLAESMAEAMQAYPRSNAVLVRRHGVYIWGDTWEAAKTQAECYHYLFEAAGAMRALGLDPGAVPTGAATGVGAARAYGSGRERDSSYAGLASGGGVAPAPASSSGGGGGGSASASGGLSTPVRPEALGAGWHGAAGTSAAGQQHEHAGGCCGGGGEAGGAAAAAAFASPQPLPARDSFSHVVLDVEGCTTSLAFVAETLFPYAAAALPAWLAAQWGSARGPAGEDVAALCALSAADVAAGLEGAAEHALDGGAVLGAWRAGAGGAGAGAAQAALVRNVAWQMRAGRKSGALKALQGHIWREGYESGALRGHVFEDTPGALRGWAAGGKRAYIYSSGSREAQVLLFSHSTAGDLTGLLSGYFDTSVGVKVESASYADICATLGVGGGAGARRVLFATDSLPEAVAARAAGMQAVLTVRPGNNALPEAAREFPWVQSLAELV